MAKTRIFFQNHHLSISKTKTKIMTYEATSGKTLFQGSPNLTELSLDQVISFKYLGVTLNSSPYSFLKNFNDQVKQRAQNYLSRILNLVKTGPDRSSLAYALWSQVALPSILYGTEVLPLTQKTISEVEKIQNAVGKTILQLPRSSANVSVNLDAGLKPIFAHVAEKVLLYARNTMSKPSTFWPKLAMTDNVLLGPKSTYTRYLMKWNQATNFPSSEPKLIKKSIKKLAMSHVLSQQRIFSTSTFAMNPPGSSASNQWFTPKPWVSDSGFSQIFSQFRSCNAGLGNRGPAKNGQIYKLCPLCAKNGQKALNNEVKIMH